MFRISSQLFVDTFFFFFFFLMGDQLQCVPCKFDL